MKTNITIASNIFVRADSNIRHDPEFVGKIRGRAALHKLKKQYESAADGIRLSDWQEKMYSEDNTCLFAKNGEKTHGPILKEGRIVWVGRCEYSACPRYNQCSETSKVVRSSSDDEFSKVGEEENRIPLQYEWLGNIGDLFERNNDEKQMPEEKIAEFIIEDMRSFTAGTVYEKIENPICVIEDDVESRILVNAAPGTGKTYTVTRRIEYIIRNQLIDDFSNLLVLVYTNAAKNEILTRLKAGISDGILPYSARNVDICTFDSLATSYLAARDIQFASLNFDERIKLFNERFNKEDFADFTYVIIDELQDVVNERAKMVLNILSALEGGYLLLGDKCQAIYDYDCNEGDAISSVDFYKRLGEALPPNVKRYELMGNKRQINELATLSDSIRYALLNCDIQNANKAIADRIRQIESAGRIEQSDFSKIKTRTAILCRSNGEAEYVSHILNKNKVRHFLLRSVGQGASLHRFIADCFWDYHEERITRSGFSDRYCERVKDDVKAASDIFDILSETVYDDVKEVIELEKLIQVLNDRPDNLDSVLANEEEYLLTVSTIHKAKGREFDTVYLLDNGFSLTGDNTEEARVWYVGCTRAKEKLYKLSRSNIELKRSVTCNVRWIQLKCHRAKWTSQLKKHCANIVLGLPMDIDEAGFVNGDISRALKRQEYIAEKVSVGDSVEIVLEEGRYKIKHFGNVVGYLTNRACNQLYNIVRESNPVSKLPVHLEPVYVTNIATIIPEHFPEGVSAYFRDSRFWLGLELTGFPKADYNQ